VSGSFVHKSIIAGCRCFAGSLPSGPHEEEAMRNEDHPATASEPQRPKALRGAWILIALLAIGGLLFGILVIRDDDGSDVASRNSEPNVTAFLQTTTSADPRTELVSRLEEILARRELAYQSRDPDILKEIYTVDCPCLKSDSNAIRELISENYKWVGGEISIRVRSLERVRERMWILIADFTSEPLRVETESGRTVRIEPRGSEVFQFVLARPVGSSQWLLGRASSYESG
jgi:hypothetical protein